METLTPVVIAAIATFVAVALALYCASPRRRLRRETSRAETEYETTLSAITNAVPAFIAYVDREERYQFVNASYEKFFGRPRETFIGRSVREVVEPARYEILKPYIDRALAGEDVFFEVDFKDLSGKRFSMRGHYSPKVTDGNPDGFYVILFDVSDLKEKEAALEDYREHTRILVQAIESCSAGITLADPYGEDLPLTYANEAFCAITGYSREEVLGRNCRFLQGPATDPAAVRDIRAAIENGRQVKVELVNYRKDGTPFWNNLLMSPVFDKNGKLLCYVGIQQDVTALKEAERELERAKEAAEKASLAKSDFLASMSHEIRTPLNGIIGTASLLSRTNLEGRQKAYLETIIQSGDLLQSLINDVLDFSKIEASKLHLSQQIFPLRPLLQSTFSVFEPVAREKGLGYHFSCDPRLDVRVVGDPARLRQILSNLLSNAIKFTEIGSVTLTVDAEDSGDESSVGLSCIVEDSGRGIPDNRQGQIFEKFYQVGAEGNDEEFLPGSGLGLAISKSIVEMMGGTIGFSSKESKGSRFWFSIKLPVARCEDGTTSPPAPDPDLPRFDACVLIAEDVETNRMIIGDMLEQLGCTVERAENGREALDKAKSGNYDAILMDVRMPVMDGLEATREIRHTGNAVPVIALTAYASRDSEDACRSAGMNGFVAKPMKIEALAAALMNALGNDGGATTEAAKRDVSPGRNAKRTPVFDPSFLDDLAKRKPDAAIRFASLSLKDASDLLSEASQALRKGDLETVQGSAHALKSLSAQVGAMALAEIAKRAEKSAAAGDAEQTGKSVADMKRALRTVRPHLKRYIEKAK